MYFLAHVLQDKNGWRLGDGTVKDGTAWQGANRFWATGGQFAQPLKYSQEEWDERCVCRTDFVS